MSSHHQSAEHADGFGVCQVKSLTLEEGEIKTGYDFYNVLKTVERVEETCTQILSLHSPGPHAGFCSPQPKVNRCTYAGKGTRCLSF